MSKYSYVCLWKSPDCQSSSFVLVSSLADTASSSHSLLHFRHAMLLEGRPQFAEMTYLDSQPIQYYDSNTGRMRPLTSWLNQMMGREYWTWESIWMTRTMRDFFEKVQHLSVPQKHNQSNGEKTKQQY